MFHCAYLHRRVYYTYSFSSLVSSMFERRRPYIVSEKENEEDAVIATAADRLFECTIICVAYT